MITKKTVLPLLLLHVNDENADAFGTEAFASNAIHRLIYGAADLTPRQSTPTQSEYRTLIYPPAEGIVCGQKVELTIVYSASYAASFKFNRKQRIDILIANAYSRTNARESDPRDMEHKAVSWLEQSSGYRLMRTPAGQKLLYSTDMVHVAAAGHIDYLAGALGCFCMDHPDRSESTRFAFQERVRRMLKNIITLR